MQLNLHRLWIFVQVVECGGFSAAAQKIYMSQPSVSNQVRQLEQSLHTTLIDRSGSRIRPTAEGEVLLEYARRVFLLADEAVSAIGEVSGLVVGRVVVGGTTTVGTYLLPPLVASFRKQHPGIECDIFTGNAGEVTRALLGGDIGLAILAGRPASAQVLSEQVLDDRVVLVVPPDHPLAGQHVEPDALAKERFLVREQGSQTRQLQEDALERWELTGVNRTEIWGPETIKQSVSVGLGVSLISEHAVARELQDGRLAMVEVANAARPRPIVLAYRRDRLLSAAEKAFARVVRSLRGWPTDSTSPA